jgi:integrase
MPVRCAAFGSIAKGWASLALRAGVLAKVVQERLGHSSNAITLDQFSHLADGMDRSAAETVAEVFGK